jgi:hypothetical protein
MITSTESQINKVNAKLPAMLAIQCNVSQPTAFVQNLLICQSALDLHQPRVVSSQCTNLDVICLELQQGLHEISLFPLFIQNQRGKCR